MFETIQPAPPDPILGLGEAFAKDTNPRKINLSVGVFKDAQGNTPVLATVKEAERRLLASEQSKGYLPIDGSADYARLVQQLVLGGGHEAIKSGRAVTAHTPGGTAALRVAAEFLARTTGTRRVWLSKPTWPNHPNVFEAAGLEVKSYPYFDAATNLLAFGDMLEALARAQQQDAVCLHGCCHNPTGIDPMLEEWRKIGEIVREKRLLPIVDFAYQGFGDGLKEDAAGLLQLLGPESELLICSSFSKNFGLYNERVGALTVVAATPAAAQAALSHVKACVRANYSNPPAHGGAIVATILADASLRADWEKEVAAMRQRINGMRRLFADTLTAKGAKRDFSFITRQRGMFSYSGLTPAQVDELRTRHAIYIVGSGRINVAGMTEANMDRLCEAIASVL